MGIIKIYGVSGAIMRIVSKNQRLLIIWILDFIKFSLTKLTNIYILQSLHLTCCLLLHVNYFYFFIFKYHILIIIYFIFKTKYSIWSLILKKCQSGPLMVQKCLCLSFSFNFFNKINLQASNSNLPLH